QWEYACRSGTTTPWSFADFETYERFVRDYAFVSTQNPKTKKWTNNPRPSRVGIRKPNAFGLYDMHGNVWEYVADYWHRLSYKESPLNDPTGPAVQSEKGDLRRIIRGGSYDWARWGSQSIYRMRITQRSTQHPHQGFRVAMRIKGIKGAPPAVDPDAARRQKARDPGANSAVVRAALKKSELKRQLPSELTINIGNHKMEFVLIPAGSFLMGSEKGPRDERPIHRVVISKPFYMAKYVVTQSLWERLLGKDKRLAELRTWQGDMTGPAKAMNGLTWHDCQRFIAALKKEARIGSRSRETSDDDRKPPNSHEFGYEFSLPTEAQWEYACRAGGTTEFSFGDDPSVIGEYAQFAGNMRWGNPPRNDYWFHDVGLKKSNKFGLYDMHGGVWEWCADWYDEDYYFDSPLADPKGPESGRFRVLRGGSWFRYPKYARSAYRRFCHPNINSGGVTAYLEDFGCRVVINLDDTNKVGRISNPSKKKKDELETRPTRREVNYTKLARGLVRYSKNPVIEVGKKGQWNDQTLGCFTVLDDGDTFYFYSGGARFGKGKNVGMATSKDGVNWTYFDKNPLFAGAMPYAIKVGDTFRLYHPTGGGLQLRTSKDGFRWSQPKKVMSGCMDPCVVQVAENKYHMYFCDGGRIKKDGKQVWQFKNYVATSGDGITWKRQPKPVLPLGAKGTWDEASHAGPCVLKLPDGFHMWYLGSGPMNDKIAWRIGHATSPDGVNWTKSAKEPVLDVGKPGAWDQGTFMSFDIIYRDGKFLFWYAAAPTGHGDETKMRIQIGHGTSK
ncbi:MAG: SUMF1/EgtB/PvdO family nonheme iron enzyme, partial [Pirellulaceae bacterium]|nr:SUMF1/EgtB/PvdO family nonheme iron enzyme [Pirellulaceae bacterium]